MDNRLDVTEFVNGALIGLAWMLAASVLGCLLF